MTTVLAITYALLGVLALVLIPASARKWFGLEPDPLAGLFAVVLGWPWLTIASPADSELTALAMGAGAIAANTLLILVVGLALRRVFIRTTPGRRL